MAMTSEEIEILRESLRRFVARRDDMAERFYANLFDIAPETKRLFGPDIMAQTEKTMLALGVITAQMHNQDTFRPLVGDLARRHVDYGVVAEDYPSVGAALIRTIEQVFGDATPPEWIAAWRKAYDEMAGVMIETAYPEHSPAVA